MEEKEREKTASLSKWKIFVSKLKKCKGPTKNDKINLENYSQVSNKKPTDREVIYTTDESHSLEETQNSSAKNA